MSTTETRAAALAALEQARSQFERQLLEAPAESLRFLQPGDDYALGGLVHHVNAVLEHYLNVLDAIVASGFQETEAADRPGLFEDANARAKAGASPDELAAALGELRRLHGTVTAHLGDVPGDDFERKVPVRYTPGADPYPTSAADVAGWLTGHYEEHAPQVRQLLESWRSAR
jgi:hypothetical protein